MSSPVHETPPFRELKIVRVTVMGAPEGIQSFVWIASIDGVYSLPRWLRAKRVASTQRPMRRLFRYIIDQPRV